MPLSFIIMLTLQAWSPPVSVLVAFDATATIIAPPSSGKDDPKRYDNLKAYLGCLYDAALRFEPLGETFDATIEVSRSACMKERAVAALDLNDRYTRDGQEDPLDRAMAYMTQCENDATRITLRLPFWEQRAERLAR